MIKKTLKQMEREIDHEIDRWHYVVTDSSVKLHEFLKMTEQEFDLFVKNPVQYISQRYKQSHCAMCEEERNLTFHHLIPQVLHSRNAYKHLTKAELNYGIYICKHCHSGIHKLFNNAYIGKFLYSLHLLMNNNKICKHVAWSKKQKYVPTKT